MSDPSGPEPRIDLVNTSIPNAARICNYLLGGKDNYQADRDAAEQLHKLIPEIVTGARANHLFLERVVHYLVQQAGIRQIIDIGAGLPTQDNVHQMAQRLAPDTRVAYVDKDPVVIRHGQAYLATNPLVAMVESDLRTPREIMTHPEISKQIDFSRPVAVLMLASLHFVTDAESPHEIVELWRKTLPYGSYLAISHITADAIEPAKAKAAQEVYASASAPAVPRTRAQVESFFDGFELVAPGVVDINSWPVLIPGDTPKHPVLLYGGVGRR
jgi:O-methyltransferase involved in polyketide biosynthesis